MKKDDMDVVHRAMRTDLKKLIEERHYSEARNIHTQNPYLHGKHDIKYW